MSRDILLRLVDTDPEQPRKHFDQAALDELAQSMAANGLAVPILLRPAGERYIIVHGERRYRAACMLGWETIPAEVRDVSPDEAGWLALIENVQRADLSPIEEARAYRARLDAGMTQQALGERIGKSQSHIATKLRFLRLSEDMQAALDRGELTEGHAKQLLRIDDMDLREAVYNLVQSEGLSVAHTAEMISRALAPTTNYHALVQTTGPTMARAREFAVWSAAVQQGQAPELERARRIIDTPNPSFPDLVWAAQTSEKWQRIGAEVHLRAERELGEILGSLSKQQKYELADAEAGLDVSLHRLHTSMRAMATNLQDVKAHLTPAQFEQWLAAERQMNLDTASDFMAYTDINSITDRIIDHFVVHLQDHHVT